MNTKIEIRFTQIKQTSEFKIETANVRFIKFVIFQVKLRNNYKFMKRPLISFRT